MGRRAMGEIKDLNSTAVYAWTTLISVFICVPAAIIMEGSRLSAATEALKTAHPNFYMDLVVVRLPPAASPLTPAFIAWQVKIRWLSFGGAGRLYW